MESEVNVFYRKLAAVNVGIGIVWAVSFIYKKTVFFLLRKIRKKFRTTSKEIDGNFQQVAQQIPDFSCIPVVERGNINRDEQYPLDTVNWVLATGKFNIKPCPNWQVVFADEQDTHAMHRFRFLVGIGYEFSITGNPNTLAFIKSVIADWINGNKQRTQPGWHPYTLSERLIHWSWILKLIQSAESLEDELWWSKVRNSMYVQAHYLYHNFETHFGHHNHLINNVRALLTVSSLLPENKQFQTWKKYAITIFNREWPYQILPDGVHAEQSVTYHFLLTRSLWEIKLLLQHIGEVFLFDKDLKRMIAYARMVTRPDGTIPLLGHITPDWHWQELVGLLPVWGYKDRPASALGRLYQQSATRELSENEVPEMAIFPFAGQGIIRTNAIHLVLSCDPRHTLTVHGDQNQLGVDLWYAGTHLIRDTGLAAYNLDAQRIQYESWQGQSTFSIDGLDPIVSNWRKSQLPGAYFKATTTLEGDEEHLSLQASHTGFCRLPDPVTVHRLVACKDNGDIHIEDRMIGKDKHRYYAKFHFGSNTVKQLSDNMIQILDSTHGNRFELQWQGDLDFVLEENPYAIAYGEEVPGLTGSFSLGFKGNTIVQYIIRPVHLCVV